MFMRPPFRAARPCVVKRARAGKRAARGAPCASLRASGVSPGMDLLDDGGARRAGGNAPEFTVSESRAR